MAFALYVISGLISLGLVVHCIKTGRNTIWVYVLVILMTTVPFVGALLYTGVEILPDLPKTASGKILRRELRSLTHDN